MSHVQAQRRLVKSPPELWTELSDAAALARHLGELGEIRITRLEPESKVVWEGERASGEVELDQAGWGTQVTFRVNLAEPEPAEPEPEPEPIAAEPLAAEPELIAAETEPEPELIAPEPEFVTAEPELAAFAPEPEPEPEPEREPAAFASGPLWGPPRPSFWSRLFGRRDEVTEPGLAATSPAPAASQWPWPWPEPAAVEPPAPDPVALEPEPVEPEPVELEPVAVEPESDPEPEPEPEPTAADRTAELLEGVLDQLGAAHHRPFSRA
jgi:hypothetical protein